MYNNRFWSLGTARWVLIANAIVLILCYLKAIDSCPRYLDDDFFRDMNRGFLVWFKFFLPLTTTLTLSIKSLYGNYDDENITLLRFGLFSVFLVFLTIIGWLS